MLPALIRCVRNGGETEIKQFLNQGKDVVHFSAEDGRELFKEAIMSANYEAVELFIDLKILGKSPQEYLKAVEGRTLFGLAVHEMYDERLIEILSSNGYDILCYEECCEFVSNLTENCKPGDHSRFNACLDKLKLVLAKCSNVFWQRTLRTLLYNEERVQEAIKSVEWLNNYFKYGYGLCMLKTVNKIYMEIGEELWSDALESISALEENEVDDYVYESFPPGENIPELTLLAYAIFKRNFDIVKILIIKGADVNKHSERFQNGRLIKFTPFELAVEINFLECCCLLIDNGSNLFLQSYNSMGNILKNAICNENVAMVKLILKNRSYSDSDIQVCIDDVDRDVRDVNVKAQITECLKVYRRFEMIDTTRTIKGMLLIEDGAEQEALEFIEDFTVDELNEEIMPETLGRQSWTLLTFATKLNKLNIVKALLNKGCNVDQCTRKMSYHNEISVKNALMFAIEENNCDMCELLLNRGAFISTGVNSVLECAFIQKNSHILSLLVQRLRDQNEVLIQFCLLIDTLISLRDILETFSLELVCFIFQTSRIEIQTWVKLIQRCLARREWLVSGGAERGHCLLYLFVDYLSFVPPELNTALLRHYDQELPGHSIEEERKWLQRRVTKCSSLQDCCRYAVRQTVRPFTENNVERLGLPLLLQEYLLEHPLQKYLDNEQRDY